MRQSGRGMGSSSGAAESCPWIPASTRNSFYNKDDVLYIVHFSLSVKWGQYIVTILIKKTILLEMKNSQIMENRILVPSFHHIETISTLRHMGC